MDLTWRPLQPDDTDAWVALVAAVEAVDETGEHEGADDFAELATGLDLAAASVAAFDGPDMVAQGAAWVRSGVTDLDRVWLVGTVRPSHRRRGVGRELLARLVDSARTQHAARYPAARLEVHSTSHQNNAGHQAMLTAAGFSPVRWFFDMRADLSAAPPELSISDGLRIEPYHPDVDDELRLTRNDCFAEHWGSTQCDEEFWRNFFTGSQSFLPEHSVHLRDEATGTMAAFVLSRFQAADAEARGHREIWIGDVGTRAAWRGRGIATALLASVLAEARKAGFASAGLSVDSGNATGALGVYERCGFAVTDRWTTYALPLD
ncbi:GNAT family N-acetyltransferase [Actinokineospora sp.]|uniref:GNAT family N-acetyltransferase n=1 Tax=Actinokineospora sp. TaxID=1872133 RepID=UPI004037A65E